MYPVYAFAAGFIFGLGLIVSELYNPAKVLGFLDLAGKWDPSLALTMVCALAISLVAFTIVRTRTATLIATPLHLPKARGIDRRLVLGSLAFGVGWGLAGFAPGSALVALGTGHVKAFLFVVAMLAGMGIFELLERRSSARAAQQPPRSAHAHPHAGHVKGGAHRERREHG